MNKRFVIIISLGVLLTVFLIALGLTISAVYKKRAEINALNKDLKNKDAKLNLLEKQVESLNAEKSSLAGVKLSLEGRLANLELDINSTKEKESALSKKMGAFVEEKKKLEDALAQTTQSMQEKLGFQNRKIRKN